MKTLESLNIEKALIDIQHYKYNCDFCHKDMVFNLDEDGVERVLFEPEEKNLYKLDDNYKFQKFVCKQMFSTNPDEDLIKFKCPNCGHYHTVKWKNIKNKKCNYWGL